MTYRDAGHKRPESLLAPSVTAEGLRHYLPPTC